MRQSNISGELTNHHRRALCVYAIERVRLLLKRFMISDCTRETRETASMLARFAAAKKKRRRKNLMSQGEHGKVQIQTNFQRRRSKKFYSTSWRSSRYILTFFSISTRTGFDLVVEVSSPRDLNLISNSAESFSCNLARCCHIFFRVFRAAFDLKRSIYCAIFVRGLIIVSWRSALR